MKVRCIKNGYGWTKEKIYEVHDGIIKNDIGCVIEFSSVETWNELHISQFELVKETTPKVDFCKVFGVTENEEFAIVYDKTKINGYKFVNNELINSVGAKSYKALVDLLNGECTIEKLPWKPKDGDTVYFVDNRNYDCSIKFDNHIYDLAMLKAGWYFPTEEEAEANKERVLKEYEEVLRSN